MGFSMDFLQKSKKRWENFFKLQKRKYGKNKKTWNVFFTSMVNIVHFMKLKLRRPSADIVRPSVWILPIELIIGLRLLLLGET